MQWSNNRNAGFSSADPDDLYNPVVDEGEFGYEQINVADQLTDADSLLNRIERLVDARHLCSEISEGHFSVVDVDPKEVWVHRIDQAGTVLLCAHNTASEERRVTVDFDAPDETTACVAGDGDYDITDGTCTFDLAPCDYVWLRGDTRGERVPLGEP
jgi:maltose alpha-D-glucosyltransferase/alpha-amylase